MLHDVLGDLFDFQHSLAHCISSDGKMSLGIARDFVEKFPNLMKLRNMHLEVGTVVPVRVGACYVYNLVTKCKYYNKPSLAAVQYSLCAMRAHALVNNVTNIGVPLLGAGLDKLDFERGVRPLLQGLFDDALVDVYIHYVHRDDMPTLHR